MPVLARLKIGTRVYVGFAVTLILMAAIATIGVTSLKNGENQFRSYANIAGVATLALDIGSDVSDVQRLVRDFSYSGDEKTLEPSRKAIGILRQKIDQGIKSIHNPERLQAMTGISGKFDSYAAGFEQLVDVKKKCDQMLFGTLGSTGADMQARIIDLIETSMKAGDFAVAAEAGLMGQFLMQARLDVSKFSGHHDSGAAVDFKDKLGRLRTTANALAGMTQDPKYLSASAQVIKSSEIYTSAFEEFFQLSSALDSLVNRTLADLGTAATDQSDQIKDRSLSDLSSLEATANAAIGNAIQWAASLGIGAFVLGIVSAAVIARGIIRPIRGMTQTMTRLAGGDKAVVVPALGNRDEIGDMARAVEVFKQHAIRVEQMTRDQEAQKHQAELDRRAALRKMADTFEGSVGKVVETVTSAATQLQASAGQMSASATQTSSEATAVAASSQQASANVQTVASATEELAASISEIARQMSRSRSVALQANEDAEHTTELVKTLSDSVAKIGTVVGLINDIASQTNLLALNATIEAARAGDAGKGFAVVANEVKGLANQTAKATGEIASQIADVQHQTAEAVAAITEISSIISEMSDISGSVAAAVQEQTAATGEIARNVEQAAAGTQEVSSSISSVEQAAKESGAAAEQIRCSSLDLSKQAEYLHHEVVDFLQQVRADRNDMKLVTWSDNLSTGLSLIDRHHREMFDHLNDFYGKMMFGEGREGAAEMESQLAQSMRAHFDEEESEMGRAGFADLAAHRRLHQEFLARFDVLRGALASGRDGAAAELFEYVSGWLTDHIQNKDHAFAVFVQRRRAA
ncbi:bacteriohemerythrin [Telmatospirillum sp.]|uniref:bacteriohemerythrin n=1 Tax=Telmatospirillum sp. TaxID=2079197 RepID=UPI00284E1153|nr:bacteriohemerythrin [Telmatospirillum sp.]MDR3437041.1 bacteriohemerythrin [Telmatospirillum sp.]